MKKITAIVWLLACLLPAGVRAEEPVVQSTGTRLSQAPSPDEKQHSRSLLVSEVTVADEELLQAVGSGFDAPLPVGSYFFRKWDISDSRIKLWDEADRGLNGKNNLFGLGTFQKITLSVAER